ncbi:hypothetical protein RchiOBHm_Chr3g0462581 [Rosa chinensis]|uniref:Uncharacterized protein n=1 Tax=Rosa chinensis TaxID=74649 RepID=A0A2P6R8Y0_ROSCH|nr:hypothetical protein RchiOBHm_Chr3g0462581 [Rosa chinensis]
MLASAKNCKGLKKLSCGSYTFGAKGMNAVLENCLALEELSVKRLRGIWVGRVCGGAHWAGHFCFVAQDNLPERALQWTVS